MLNFEVKIYEGKYAIFWHFDTAKVLKVEKMGRNRRVFLLDHPRMEYLMHCFSSWFGVSPLSTNTTFRTGSQFSHCWQAYSTTKTCGFMFLIFTFHVGFHKKQHFFQKNIFFGFFMFFFMFLRQLGKGILIFALL